jgi:hypothetical protein
MIIKAKQVLLMKRKLWENENYSVSYRVHKYKNICNCKKNNTYSTTNWLWSRKSKYYNRVSTNPRNSNPCKSRTYRVVTDNTPTLKNVSSAVVVYPSIHVLTVKIHFTLYCTEAAYFCLRTSGILLSQDTESVICVHVVDVLYVLYIKNFKTISHALFKFWMGITFDYHFNFF